MKENEIAAEKVYPYICKELKWPEQLVSKYGRVPVQIGGTTVWADFVCYILNNQKVVPWLLFEVKQSVASLEQALPQAESYSLIIGAYYFCVTDGDHFKFYMTGKSQGNSIKLDGLPKKPSSDYTPEGFEYICFPEKIDSLVESFIEGLKSEDKFYADTRWHNESAKRLHGKIFERIDSISADELKEVIEENVMMKTPNKNQIFIQIDQDLERFKKMLHFISEFPGDPVSNINHLLDKSDPLYIRGGGIFFITQLLAGAHPDEYVVLEENISRALRSLSVTDILVKNDTANGYIYINEICKKLFKDKMEDKLKLKGYEGFGLATVHNFLWHYYAYYLDRKKWYP